MIYGQIEIIRTELRWQKLLRGIWLLCWERNEFVNL